MNIDSKSSNLITLLNKTRHYHAMNEANTKSTIIVPILQELQWNVRSPFEVTREYTLGTGKVDYALKFIDEIKVLIEVKKMGENLDNAENQIKKYAIDKKIYLFILSDGLRWQFYTWLKEGIEIFKFHDIDIKIQEPQFVANELVNILSKENIFSNKSYDYIRNIIKKDPYKFALYEEIINIWHKMLDEPHPSLCNLIIELVKELFGRSAEIQDVKKVLSAYNIEFKSRGKIIIDGPSEFPKNDEEFVMKNIKRLHELKKTEWIKKRNIAQRIYRRIKPKQLDQILNNLYGKGLIQLKGKVDIKLINNKDNLY